jgi:hypothetical protein
MFSKKTRINIRNICFRIRYMNCASYSVAADRTKRKHSVKLKRQEREGKVKVKVKFNLEQALKSQRGSKGIALLFLNIGARWGGLSTSRPGRFPPGKTQYPLCRRMGGPGADLDGCGKSRPHRDWIPGPSSP